MITIRLGRWHRLKDIQPENLTLFTGENQETGSSKSVSELYSYTYRKDEDLRTPSIHSIFEIILQMELRIFTKVLAYSTDPLRGSLHWVVSKTDKSKAVSVISQLLCTSADFCVHVSWTKKLSNYSIGSVKPGGTLQSHCILGTITLPHAR